MYSGVRAAPLQRLCVFSRQIRRVRGKWTLSERMAASMSCRRRVPSGWFGHSAGMDAAQCGRSTRLVQKAVAEVAEDDLVAAAAVRQDRNQVAHRPADHQQGRLLAEPLGGHLLEPVDGGVLTEDVVAKLGMVNRLPHLRRGKSYSIAAKINRSHPAFPVRREFAGGRCRLHSS